MAPWAPLATPRPRRPLEVAPLFRYSAPLFLYVYGISHAN